MTNLMIYLPLNEDSGNPIDYSGFNKTTTISNVTQGVTGKYTKGCLFGGTNCYVHVTVDFPVTAYTAMAWIKPASFTVGGEEPYRFTIFAASILGGYVLWLALTSTGEFKFWKFTNTLANYDITSGANIQLGNWYHVAVTATQNGAAEIFLNGSKIGSFVAGNDNWISTGITVGELRIGRNICFNGTIDEFRFFDYVLSDEDIRKMYLYPFGVPSLFTLVKG